MVESLDRPPIIMGHSFGGTFTQLLVNRGLGAAAVTIDSAPPEGVRVNPPSQIKSLFPILANPANRHRAVGFTREQFHYAFAHTCSREESDAAYDRLHIPAPGSWVWAYGLIANWKPGHQETWVDYDLDDRAPLLFTMGGEDHLNDALGDPLKREEVPQLRGADRDLRVPGPLTLHRCRVRPGTGGRLRARMGDQPRPNPAGPTNRRQRQPTTPCRRPGWRAPIRRNGCATRS